MRIGQDLGNGEQPSRLEGVENLPESGSLIGDLAEHHDQESPIERCALQLSVSRTRKNGCNVPDAPLLDPLLEPADSKAE